MITIKTRKKTIRWNYRRCWDNISPILFVVGFFVMYAIVSTMEYKDLID